MAKWNVTLSTTEPFNYIGIVNVRQGNRNSEVMEATIVENGLPYDLTDCTVLFEAMVGEKYPIQRAAKTLDAKKGKVQYTFDEYSMQLLHRQTANFIIYKGENLIATTQNFSYFVVNAVSKTAGEMGSYWQTVEDLIADMVAFINAGKGDFNAWMAERKEEFEAWRQSQQDGFESWRKDQEADYLAWFESIKYILESVDPGGILLKEMLDARVDLQGVRHDSVKERLTADLEYIYNRVKHQLDLIVYKNIPAGYRVTIEHDSEYQPAVSVTYYENSIDTELDGFDSSGQFGGGTIFNVPIQLSYDRKKAYVEMPLFYALNDGEFNLIDDHTLVLIEGNKVLNFTVAGAKISAAYHDERKPETVRIPRDLELLILDDATVQLNWKRGIL